MLQILANEHKRAGLGMEQFLPVNEHTKGRCLRSEDASRIKKYISRGCHDNKLSVFKRQEKLFDLFMGRESSDGILGKSREQRKNLVEKFILDTVTTEQNSIRHEVKHGMLKNPDTKRRI